MTTPTQYKPLGLAQVCEIRDEVDAAVNNAFYADWAILDTTTERWARAGFDPADVRQAAEEALENLRK